MAATIDVVRAVAPDTRFLCVLNGVPPRGPRQPQARRLLGDMGVPVSTPSLGLRAAVDYAAAAGASAQEHEPRGKAAAEIAAVYDVVRDAVGLSAAQAADLPDSRQNRLSTTEQANLPASRQDHLSASREGDLPTTRQVRWSASREGRSPTSRQTALSTIREPHKPASGPARRDPNGRQAP